MRIFLIAASENINNLIFLSLFCKLQHSNKGVKMSLPCKGVDNKTLVRLCYFTYNTLANNITDSV